GRRGEPLRPERFGEREPDDLGPYVEAEEAHPAEAPHGPLRFDDGVRVVAEDLRHLRVDRRPALVRPRHEDHEPFLLRDAVPAAADVLDREAIDLADHDRRLRLLGRDHLADGDRALGTARLADEEREPTFLLETGDEPLAL